MDYNGDGKLDILVGDQTILDTPHKGISNEEYAEKEIQYRKLQDYFIAGTLHSKALNDYKILLYSKDKSPETKKATQEALELTQQIKANSYKQEVAFKKSFKTTKQVGFVWLYLQK